MLKCSLPKGSTLANYIQAEFGIKNNKTGASISEEIALSWIQKFYMKYKRMPNVNDGIIEFAAEEFAGLTWRLLNNYLHKGSRGLAGRSSLKLLKEKMNTYDL